MTKDQVTEKLYRAYRTLLAQDCHLLEVDANERSITHKLGEYLQAEFPDWNVDCEYNRYFDGLKVVAPWKEKKEELINELSKEKITDKQREAIENILDGNLSVYPDIIIHHRGTRNNFVVIEAKKSSYSGVDADVAKLKAYKANLGYKFAFKIKFKVGAERSSEAGDGEINCIE